MKLPNFLPDNDSPSSVRNWRVRQAVIACSCWVVTAFFVLPALIGVPYTLPKIGGVAWANDVREIRQASIDTRSMLLDMMIFDSQKSWCESYRRGDRSPYAAARVRDLSKEYSKLTGQAPNIPTCDQI